MQLDRCRSADNGFSGSDVKVIGSIRKTRQTGSYTPFRRWWQPDERMPTTICPIAGLIKTKARRKNASTITFGNGFQIFVPFPPCFLFPPFVPLFPLQPLLPPIIPLTSSVLPLSLPVCLARPRALYTQARVDGAGCATMVQKWINSSYAKFQTGSFSLQPSISLQKPDC